MPKRSPLDVQGLLGRLAAQHERIEARRSTLANDPKPEAPRAPGPQPGPQRSSGRGAPRPIAPADLALRPTREFAGHFGHLYGRAGRPALEGGLVAVLLSRSGPVPLAEAARTLQVTKATLGRVARAMEARGDLERVEGSPAGAHAYRLTSRAGHARLLRQWRDLSLEAARACEEAADRLGRDDPEVRDRLLDEAGLHEWAAASLKRVTALGAEAGRED